MPLCCWSTLCVVIALSNLQPSFFLRTVKEGEGATLARTGIKTRKKKKVVVVGRGEKYFKATKIPTEDIW